MSRLYHFPKSNPTAQLTEPTLLISLKSHVCTNKTTELRTALNNNPQLINKTDKAGTTLLFYAILHNNYAAITLLRTYSTLDPAKCSSLMMGGLQSPPMSPKTLMRLKGYSKDWVEKFSSSHDDPMLALIGLTLRSIIKNSQPTEARILAILNDIDSKHYDAKIKLGGTREQAFIDHCIQSKQHRIAKALFEKAPQLFTGQRLKVLVQQLKDLTDSSQSYQLVSQIIQLGFQHKPLRDYTDITMSDINPEIFFMIVKALQEKTAENQTATRQYIALRVSNVTYQKCRSYLNDKLVRERTALEETLLQEAKEDKYSTALGTNNHPLKPLVLAYLGNSTALDETPNSINSHPTYLLTSKHKPLFFGITSTVTPDNPQIFSKHFCRLAVTGGEAHFHAPSNRKQFIKNLLAHASKQLISLLEEPLSAKIKYQNGTIASNISKKRHDWIADNVGRRSERSSLFQGFKGPNAITIKEKGYFIPSCLRMIPEGNIQCIERLKSMYEDQPEYSTLGADIAMKEVVQAMHTLISREYQAYQTLAQLYNTLSDIMTRTAEILTEESAKAEEIGPIQRIQLLDGRFYTSPQCLVTACETLCDTYLFSGKPSFSNGHVFSNQIKRLCSTLAAIPLSGTITTSSSSEDAPSKEYNIADTPWATLISLAKNLSNQVVSTPLAQAGAGIGAGAGSKENTGKETTSSCTIM